MLLFLEGSPGKILSVLCHQPPKPTASLRATDQYKQRLRSIAPTLSRSHSLAQCPYTLYGPWSVVTCAKQAPYSALYTANGMQLQMSSY